MAVTALLLLGVFGGIKAVAFLRFATRMLQHTGKAAAREPAVMADWRAQFGEPHEVLASFPSQVDDATATALNNNLRTLGIDMEQTQDKNHSSQRSSTEEPFKPFGDYDNAELKRVGVPIEKPTEGVRDFLKAHEAEIDRISDGFLNVHRVLVAQALVRAQGGDSAAAERALRASWNLNASLRDRPEVITQRVAISVARMHVGLTRRLPSLTAADWTGRLQEHPYRSSLLRAMVVEACGEYATLPVGASQGAQAMRADFIDFKQRLLITLRDSPVGLDRRQALGRMKEFEKDEPGTFEFLARLSSVPDWANAWHKADLLTIDTELTTRVLEAREWRARLGHWPQQIAGVEQSQVTGAHWNYSVSPTGHMTIAFSGAPVWPDERGLVLPLRFEAD